MGTCSDCKHWIDTDYVITPDLKSEWWVWCKIHNKKTWKWESCEY